MLVESGARCLSGLREKPEEAVVRAAARHFYALREQRRRRLGLGLGVDGFTFHPEKRENAPSGPGEHARVRSPHRRARPDRLRDRIRAVSHRIGRPSVASQPDELSGEGDDAHEARGDGRAQSEDPLPAESPVRPSKREIKGPRFFKSALAKERFVVSYAQINIIEVQQQDARERRPVTKRIARLFRSKGIAQTEFTSLYREALCLAGSIDDMMLFDGIDVTRSAGAMRLIRRLCGIEHALIPVTSEATLCLANWQVADELELPTDTAACLVGMHSRDEAQRRARRGERLERILKKWPNMKKHYEKSGRARAHREAYCWDGFAPETIGRLVNRDFAEGLRLATGDSGLECAGSDWSDSEAEEDFLVERLGLNPDAESQAQYSEECRKRVARLARSGFKLESNDQLVWKIGALSRSMAAMSAAEHRRLNAAVAAKHGVSVAEVQAYGRRSFDHGRRHRLQPCNKVGKLPPCFDREPGYLLASSEKKGGCFAKVARWMAHPPPRAKPTKAERRQSWRHVMKLKRRYLPNGQPKARFQTGQPTPPPGSRDFDLRAWLADCGLAGIHPGPGGFRTLFPAEDFRTQEEQCRRDALKSSYRRRQVPRITHGRTFE